MNNKKGVRPEDILSEDENDTVIRGVKVRKGSIGAVLQNANILASPLVGASEKEEASKIIAELAPALVVLGMHEHVIWKNVDIQREIEAAAAQLKDKE